MLSSQNLGSDATDDARRDLILNREDVFERLVVSVRPEMNADCCIDQLGCDAQAIAGLADASFQHVADTQLPADSPRVGSLVFVSETRIAGDHEE
jgi:hypothetical protein